MVDGVRAMRFGTGLGQPSHRNSGSESLTIQIGSEN
jgi:hypothetical protein